LTQSGNRGPVRSKTSYHHGDLREALISAAHELLIEHGSAGFALADACRRANVSSAAPYRHFRNKHDIVEQIVLRGFEELKLTNAKTFVEAGAGTVQGVTAMCMSYVEFAASQPAIFRLMFGSNTGFRITDQVIEAGNNCLSQFIDRVATFCCERGNSADAAEISIPLWTFVHGASVLGLDGSYGQFARGLDVRALVTRVTPLLLGNHPPIEPSIRGTA